MNIPSYVLFLMQKCSLSAFWMALGIMGIEAFSFFVLVFTNCVLVFGLSVRFTYWRRMLKKSAV